MIQEWWGFDFEIKSHAKKLSELTGCQVVIPDLYRGKVGSEAEEAQHLMSNLDWPGAITDIVSCCAFLKEQGLSKVGISGFCMGGVLSIASAIKAGKGGFAAVAPFYGYNPDLGDVSTLTCPLQGHFGKEDNYPISNATAVSTLEEKVKSASVESEIFIYEKVGHGFMNATPEGIERKVKLGQGSHDQEAVDLAWVRLKAFFAKHLN
jgi:carboxymethylenebutenolidase